MIRSLDDVSHCTNDNKCLAQEYFHTHKVNHHKFDVGVYVVITDIEPLRAYFYDDVLIRVCKRAYPTTIEEFVNDEETWVINDYKPIWKVAEFQKHYNGNNRDTLKAYFDTVTPNGGETLLENLNDRIRKALLIALPRIKAATRKYPSRSNFFEMVRFDFLIGEDAVPKLIEVNMSPNLAPKNEVDGRMKRRLVDGLFELVGVTPSLAAASLKPFSSSSPSLPFSVSEEGTHDNGSDAPDDTSTETHEQECDELTSCVFDCPSECLVSCPVCFGYDSNEDGLNDAHNRLVAEYKRKPAVFGMLYPTKQHWKKYENYEKNMPSCLLPPVPVKKESSSSSSPSSSSSSSSSQQKPSPKRALLKFYKKISESVSDFTDTISTGHVYAFGAVYILGMATSLLLGKRTHNQSKNNGNIGGEEVDGNIDDGSDDGRDAYKEEEQVEDSVEEIQEPLDSDRKKKQ